MYSITVQNIQTRAECAVRIGGALSNARIKNIQLTDSRVTAVRIADASVSNLLIDGVFAYPSESKASLFVSERAEGHHVEVKNVFQNSRQLAGLHDSLFHIEKNQE